MFYDAFLAGIWAAIGSTLGKLSGSPNIVGNSYLIWGLLLAVMIISNTWGCRYYLRALDAATNSVVPTVISAASSYALSLIALSQPSLHNKQVLQSVLRQKSRLSSLHFTHTPNLYFTWMSQGLIGVTMFDEGAYMLWWVGVSFIIIGLLFVGHPRQQKEHTT